MDGSAWRPSGVPERTDTDVVQSREQLLQDGFIAGGWDTGEIAAAALGGTPDVGWLLERAAWVGPDGVALVRADVIHWANPALHSICAVAPGRLEGRSLRSIEVCELRDGDDFGAPVTLEPGPDGARPRRVLLRRADGSTVAVAVAAERVQAVPDGFWVLRVREIAAHIRVDEALRASEARFRALADNAPIGVCLSDVGVRLAYVNPRFAQVWGVAAEDLLGDRWLAPIIDADLDDVLECLTQVLSGRDGEVVFRVTRPDGDVRTLDVHLAPVEGGDRQVCFVGSVEDVTDARARESALAWQARHDSLTGLPNRVELWDRIHRHVHGSPHPVSLLFFDLDDFKLVNDSMGHAAGDELLRVVAQRLSDALRGDDVVARFGGDEFVVLCPEVGTEHEAEAVANRLLRELREPIEIQDRQIRVTASAGVLVSDPRDHEVDALVRDADVAMYQAKSAGKARTAIFDAAARHLIEHRLDVVSDLRRAIAEDEVGVWYQPIVRHDDLHVVAAEALLRYAHPTLGALPANEVIEIAEASGCIDQLGVYVLDRACADLSAWRRRVSGWRPEYISVNLAASQLSSPDFEAQVVGAVEAHGLVPADLCLELTESQLMTDVHRAEEVLGALAERGFRLAIDDFGTGYSSLAYLRRFPVSLVKIERSFVADPDDPFVAAIVEAVVSVTRALGGSVVAEGVETVEQLEAIAGLGCTLIQGYLLAHPADARSLPLVPRLAVVPELPPTGPPQDWSPPWPSPDRTSR